MNHSRPKIHKSCEDTKSRRYHSSFRPLLFIDSRPFLFLIKSCRRRFQFVSKSLRECKKIKLLTILLVGLIITQIIFYYCFTCSVHFPERGHRIPTKHSGLINDIFQDIWRGKKSTDKNLNMAAHKQANSLIASKDQQAGTNEEIEPNGLPLCPSYPPNLKGYLEFFVDGVPPTLKEIAEQNPKLEKGGYFKPSECKSRSKVAFVIPHRSRELHLRALLFHLHPILQRQQIQYKIFVAQQAGFTNFNKAKLMNVAFLYSMRDDSYDCVVFHDVDLLPEDDRLLYWCHNEPRHMSVSIDKYGYSVESMSAFGGVTMVGKNQFRHINGFSNRYWGWGGEDDDMYNRLMSYGYSISRPPLHLGKYKMSFHHRDKGNKLNPIRYEILKDSLANSDKDGLNNVKYAIESIDETPIFTNITINVGFAHITCQQHLNSKSCSLATWLCENFGLSCDMLKLASSDDTI